MNSKDASAISVETVSGVVIDIDGCLLGPNLNLNFLRFSEFRSLCSRLLTDGREIVLCSGRPGPFVEALAVSLGLRGALLFEWGAGLIEDIEEGVPIYHPLLDTAYWNRRVAVIGFLRNNLMENYRCWIQPGKETAVTVFVEETNLLSDIHRVLSNFLDGEGMSEIFAIHPKNNYLDIRPRNIDKAVGFGWFLSRRSSSQNALAKSWLAIGDSIDDLSLFKCCGMGACPANADVDLKNCSHVVAQGSYLEGVIEILRAMDIPKP